MQYLKYIETDKTYMMFQECYSLLIIFLQEHIMNCVFRPSQLLLWEMNQSFRPIRMKHSRAQGTKHYIYIFKSHRDECSSISVQTNRKPGNGSV